MFFNRSVDVIKNVIFYFIVLLLGCYAKEQNELTPPVIFPEGEDYVINATQTFTLLCSGKNFVTWTAPNIIVDSDDEPLPKYSNITIESLKTSDDKYHYGSVLTISNASYLDVGYYYCHENTTDFNDLSRVSRIYIYVYDTKILTLLSELPYGIAAIEHSDGVLPCRPTSPDVKVELMQATGDEVPLGIKDDSGNFVTYDPKKGFTISTVTSDDSTLYDCVFSRDDDSIHSLVLLNVEPIPYLIAMPLLEEISDGHTIIGQKLILKCTFRYSGPFTMDWVVPNRNSGQINISTTKKTQNDDEFFQNLEIQISTLADQGEYTCIVRSTLHVHNDTKFIKVYDHMEHFINLTDENGVYDISIKAGESSVQWRIDVNAHPAPKLIWYDNKNNEIQTGWKSNCNSKYVTDIVSGKDAFLKINNITIFDRGYYKLKAINDFEEKTIKLFLNVTDKPSVDIQVKNIQNEKSK